MAELKEVTVGPNLKTQRLEDILVRRKEDWKLGTRHPDSEGFFF